MVITVRRVWLIEVLRFIGSQTEGEVIKELLPLVTLVLMVPLFDVGGVTPFGIMVGLLAPFTTDTDRVIGFAQAKDVSTKTGDGDSDSRQESSDG